MDTTDPDIVFDENGYCNHCTNAIKKLKEIYFIEPALKKNKLYEIVKRIKMEGKNKKYDCVIGLSGGVDSSYLAYTIVKELGLRPLAVHLDNGWNSELAVRNIENIVKKLGIDLYTYVINWEVFRELQLAFLRAGVIDLEMISDNAIVVAIYKIMKKYNIGSFLIGTNIATESIMPKSWFYTPKCDSGNIKAIYNSYGNGLKLKTYPMFNFFEYTKYLYLKGHKSVALLNYMPYNKAEALNILKNKMDYRPYTGKHYESKITQFYQGYILPKKYNVDKRKAHLSSLIIADQISRDSALAELNVALFKTEREKVNEIEFFCKKLGITRIEFDDIMSNRPVSHFSYPAYNKYYQTISRIIKKYL